MPITLFDLSGADDRRFSPACWRSKMALAHKGLDFEARPTLFTEIKAIGDGSFKTVPVIEDQGRWTADSAAIADYLEAQYPDRPSLFGGQGGYTLTRFVESFTVSVIHRGLFPMVVLDIHDHLDERDKPYFRQTREAMLKAGLEDVQASREGRVQGFRENLSPLRMRLSDQDYLGGEAPLYADYLVFGAFQWARSISDFPVLAEDDPLRAWLGRLGGLYDGLAVRGPVYWT